MSRTPQGPGPLVYAHRGDSAHAPDNSIEAFERAVAAGADGIELDVRRCADGYLVLSHDPTHARGGRISARTLSELRSVSEIPTLREALEVIPRHVFVNVEIKNHRTERGFDRSRTITDATIDEIEARDDPSRVLISSFDAGVVRRSRELAPHIATGLVVSRRLSAAFGVARREGHRTVHLDAGHLARDAAGLVDQAGAYGLGLFAWTVDDPTEMDRLFHAGIVGIFTNDPAVGRRVADHL
ncbi:MAG: glycerophosphodiester phosphodiesterase [Acidimicrobiia bacterium]